MKREKIIIRTSILGVVANIFLAGFKAVIGLMSHSIAVVLDAVNNLSDALSSVITIIGTKLAGKAPDKKHPLGYGRIEYLTALIVAGIVLYAGITSMTESIKKIIHPETPDYDILSLIVIASAVIVKFFLGRYVKAKGIQVSSASLIASGSDAGFDAILSFSVFLSALVFMLTSVSLEAYVGLVISGVIIKSGIEMITDTLNEILGKRTDAELARNIKKTLCQDKDVLGAYDLFLYNYGPEKEYGSVHVEIPDTMTAKEIDLMERRIQNAVFQEYGIVLTGIGIYAVNCSQDEAGQIRKQITEIALQQEGILQIHGFYIDTEEKQMRFDAVLSFQKEEIQPLQKLQARLEQQYPDYQIQIVPDIDITE